MRVLFQLFFLPSFNGSSTHFKNDGHCKHNTFAQLEVTFSVSKWIKSDFIAK